MAITLTEINQQQEYVGGATVALPSGQKLKIAVNPDGEELLKFEADADYVAYVYVRITRA